MSNCFVYGTLMAEEVLKCLIKRVPEQKPARITGFRRHALRKQVFPATVPGTETDSVVGKVLSGLTEDEMMVFDAFEGEEYYKHDVTATLLTTRKAHGGEKTTEGERRGGGGGGAGEEEEEEERVATFLYCWSVESEAARAQLLPDDWHYPSFRRDHLAGYVEMCSGFEEELRGERARAASAAARSGRGGGGE